MIIILVLKKYINVNFNQQMLCCLLCYEEILPLNSVHHRQISSRRGRVLARFFSSLLLEVRGMRVICNNPNKGC
jgi:hypothetical protein